MVDNVVVSLPTLPIDLFYRILDHLDLFTILCSMQNVCTRINAVLTSYSPYQSYTILSFDGMRIPCEILRRGASALWYNSTITTMCLEDGIIGDEGTQYLAITLCHNSTLTTLNLRNNYISEIGAKYLANALLHNTTLTTLNLKDNRLGHQGIQYLADVLPYNNALIELNLANNMLDSNAVRYLAFELYHNTTLNIINLEGNLISAAEIEDIIIDIGIDMSRVKFIASKRTNRTGFIFV